MAEHPQYREIQSSPEWLTNGVMDPNLTVAFALKQQNLRLTPEKLIAITDPPTSIGIFLDPTQIQNYAQNLSRYKEEIGKYLIENSSRIPPFAIVFPTYKEEENIGPTLRNLVEALPENILPRELIVVDSSSPDRTLIKAIETTDSSNFPPGLNQKTTIIEDTRLASLLRIDPHKTKIKPGKGTNYRLGTIFALYNNLELLQENGWIWIVDTDAQYPPYLYWNMFLAMIHLHQNEEIGMIRANLLRLTKRGKPEGPWKQGGRVTREIRRWVIEELLPTVSNEKRRQILQQFAQLHQPLTGFYGIRAQALAQMNLPYNYALETSANLQILNQGLEIAHPFMGIHAQEGASNKTLFSPGGMKTQIETVLNHFATTGETSPENVLVYPPPLEILTSQGLI